MWQTVASAPAATDDDESARAAHEAAVIKGMTDVYQIAQQVCRVIAPLTRLPCA